MPVKQQIWSIYKPTIHNLLSFCLSATFALFWHANKVSQKGKGSFSGLFTSHDHFSGRQHGCYVWTEEETKLLSTLLQKNKTVMGLQLPSTRVVSTSYSIKSPGGLAVQRRASVWTERGRRCVENVLVSETNIKHARYSVNIRANNPASVSALYCASHFLVVHGTAWMADPVPLSARTVSSVAQRAHS